MNSREKILSAVKTSQPPTLPAVDVDRVFGGLPPADMQDLIDRYRNMLQTIGGHCNVVKGFEDIAAALRHQFPEVKRIVTSFEELEGIAECYGPGDQVPAMGDVDVAVLRAEFGVAENAAVWMTENTMIDRALPFICQNLVVVIPATTIVGTMHEAYRKIGNADQGFGIFIAGPSKTADIEQALVLGAHGSVSMTVFLLQS